MHRGQRPICHTEKSIRLAKRPIYSPRKSKSLPPPPARSRRTKKTSSTDKFLEAVRMVLIPLTESFELMQAQQKKTHEQVDTLIREDDEEPLDPTAATSNGTTNRPAGVGERAALELDKSTVVLTSLTPKIRQIHLHDRIRLKIDSYTGKEDPKKWLTAFNLAMTREKYNSLDEKEANYFQVFIEHMTKEAVVWFSNLSAESIDNFDDLTNAFLKHYSMHMTRVTQNMFTMTQTQGESLRLFMEKFKQTLRPPPPLHNLGGRVPSVLEIHLPQGG
ncbi:unnamed protein product [Microthlaspi erraticum]|uniref:Retrotransposon gag domain-containing protein n=1 Tax=Microthlaspi erraticum TaxID=1685480 RepID=A0A6D2I9T4_9BRAS|nr:unnamed protein product [Microthlaspi erraticum]